MVEVILKRFEAPDEVRQMIKGRFELVHLGGLTIGRATYEPGWRWSSHVGPSVGATHCTVAHVGLVLTGTATAAFTDGRVVELRAGELFHVPAERRAICLLALPGRRSLCEVSPVIGLPGSTPAPARSCAADVYFVRPIARAEEILCEPVPPTLGPSSRWGLLTS